jgi:hypothetical protein
LKASNASLCIRGLPWNHPACAAEGFHSRDTTSQPSHDLPDLFCSGVLCSLEVIEGSSAILHRYVQSTGICLVHSSTCRTVLNLKCDLSCRGFLDTFVVVDSRNRVRANNSRRGYLLRPVYTKSAILQNLTTSWIGGVWGGWW